jgi:hypothetical protein
VAIALLVGFGAFLVTLPPVFFLLLSHYNRVTPNDPQNALGALTLGMVVGVGVAGTFGTGSLVASCFFAFARAAGDLAAPKSGVVS